MVVSINGGSQSSVYSYNTSCDVDEFSNPLSFCNSREDMKWVTYSYSFAATSSSTVLSFASTIPGLFGPVLDNVSVEAIAAIVCHRNKGNQEFKTITVGVSAVPAHLAHGDTLGQCVSN